MGVGGLTRGKRREIVLDTSTDILCSIPFVFCLLGIMI